MMEEIRMTVPARLMKDQPRSQVARSTLPAEGGVVGGQLHDKGAGSPAKALNFFSMMPETMTAATPMK